MEGSVGQVDDLFRANLPNGPSIASATSSTPRANV
jgi:hypothetical protein